MQKIYSIKDTKGSFLEPMIAQNDAVATRNIRGIVNSGKGLLAQYPEDFELWRIGEFDETTGIIVPTDLFCVVRLNALLDNVQNGNA